MASTVTVDGMEWTVLSDDGKLRRIARVDHDGYLRSRQQTLIAPISDEHWYTDSWSLPDALNPDETQALAQMLAPTLNCDNCGCIHNEPQCPLIHKGS